MLKTTKTGWQFTAPATGLYSISTCNNHEQEANALFNQYCFRVNSGEDLTQGLSNPAKYLKLNNRKNWTDALLEKYEAYLDK